MQIDFFRWITLIILVIPAQALGGAIEELQNFVNQSVSGQSTFVQRVYDSTGALVQESSGDLKFSRPGKFKWHYFEPYEQLLVGDGEFLWVYDLDLMQVTRVSLDRALGSSPAALLYGSEDIDSYFGLEALKSEGNLVRVRVIPYEESGLFERIEIGLSASMVRNMTLYDYFGQKTVIEFGRFSIPSNFNEDEFDFVVPENVDLVTQ
ncbi:MAG: outer membrane lipoprotein chaperone LolA [Burkholderiales bacterium]|nr:outer membrane lipoprotein chaperone LolA [Burkholderiales bacterium]